MSHAIETVGVTKRFPQPKGYRELLTSPLKRKEITALEDINIKVMKGELFGLLGPNGAGKTTLIKILCTLILPNEGRAFVNGHDVMKCGRKIRKSIGYVVSEERSFYWRLTGRQNLKFFATLNNLTSPQSRERIDQVVQLTGLGADIDKVFKDYSSGMRQKLAIARGLLTNPEILFLDEPTRNLDPLIAQDVRTFIRERLVNAERKTVVLATHNMHEAEKLCDRIAIMDRGHVKLCDSLNKIRQLVDGETKYVLKVNGAMERLSDALSDMCHEYGIRGPIAEPSSSGPLFRLEVRTVKESISPLLEELLRNDINVQACYPECESLEELFGRIIRRQ
ncbi:ABC transporter ATP-binding protein [Candidatus Poribacteria bacterium]|nr:ABC transporter ATP-binding protein [Candidatus Poribacteria bacterium]